MERWGDRRVKGWGLRQIKSSVSEEQYIIPATPLFPASLIPLCSFSLVAASVKCDIRWNDLNASSLPDFQFLFLLLSSPLCCFKWERPNISWTTPGWYFHHILCSVELGIITVIFHSFHSKLSPQMCLKKSKQKCVYRAFGFMRLCIC